MIIERYTCLLYIWVEICVQEKWANLFPTIVTKAQTIEVLERGSTESRSGAMLLVYKFSYKHYNFFYNNVLIFGNIC